VCVILLLFVFLEILATTLPGVSGETSSEGFVKRTKHSKLSTLPQNLVDDKEIKDTDKVMCGLVL
jgi:hypothetical protein